MPQNPRSRKGRAGFIFLLRERTCSKNFLPAAIDKKNKIGYIQLFITNIRFVHMLVVANKKRKDLNMETIPIIFSTITGNAFKLAEAASEAVPNHVGPYNIRYINEEVIRKFA